MSLVSSWHNIDVCVGLLAYDVCEAEDDKTGFLSIGMDSYDWLFLKIDQFPCPWCKLVLKIENMISEDKWKS